MTLKTGKLTYRRKDKLLEFFLCVLIFLFLPLIGYSQQYQFQFENIPVSEALLKVAQKAEIRIAFDAGSLDNFIVSERIECNEIEDVLSAVLVGTDYMADFKHNTWLIVKRSAVVQARKVTKKQVAGIIYDQNTGERLPYASVYIWDNNQFLPATVDGTFSASVKNVDQSYFQVKYLGYQTLDSIVDVSKTDGVLFFGLKQKSHNLTAINIEGNNLEMLKMSTDPGHFTFNPRRFSDLPNYGETDVFRALQFLPGISAQENSSQLNIRGSSADQNLVRFDGFTLYNLDHFFGVFSAINPNVIKDIQVYRGGFDSRYGERVSGIVDITGKAGNKSKTEIYGGINLISANLTAEVPVSEKLTVVAAVRRAYSDVYSSWLADAILADKIGQSKSFPGVDNVIEPEFYFGDFNTKLTWALNENENISISAYGAIDKLNNFNYSARENIIVDTEDVNEWGNYGFGLSWKKQYGTKYFTNLQFGHSGYYNNFDNQTSFQDPDFLQIITLPEKASTSEENDLVDYFVSFQNTYFLNRRNRFEFGLSAKYNEFEFYKDVDNSFIYSRLNNYSVLYSAYFQDQINLTEKFVVKPGLRMSFYDKTNKLYFEPRFTTSYKLTDQLLLKMATGSYYQFLNKSSSEQSYGYNRDFWVIADGNDHKVVSSNHFILGASFKTKRFFFDLEAYYKSVDGLQEYLFYSNPENRPGKPGPITTLRNHFSKFIDGEGDAYGVDFLAKYANTNFTSWLAYSISKSTRSFAEINNGDNVPASFDQTHELKWTNIYSYGKWNFSTLMLYNTGHPYVVLTSKDEDFNTTREYDRLPDYFRVDFSASYNFNIKNVNIKPGFSILNAFDTENYLDVYVRDFNFQNQEYNETTLVKAQDLTLNFFVNFSF